VINIARMNTVSRIIRCAQIMGRKETEELSAAQIFYPCMQCADIFHLKVDIAQLGMDQRKVNVLAREVAPKLNFKKPVVISHHMLMGLTEPPKIGLTGADAAIAKKMSKSNPDSAIFMTDSESEVKRKMQKAYCPEKSITDNPVLEYFRYIIFEKFEEITIERPEKFGGNTTFSSYKDLEAAYEKGEVHPLDLKNCAAKYINSLLQPVREHFEKNKEAKKLKELVESYEVTR
jgi:tyrosyl-tRNA synthetase